MSRQIALDNINLRPAERWGHTEYSMEYHTQYLSEITALAKEEPRQLRRFYELWQYDMQWRINDGLHADWLSRGRATDMGHADYAEGGSDHRAGSECPFKDAEEVWAFDAVSEYGLPDFDQQVAEYQRWLDATRAYHGDQLITGGYYKTIISGAIQTFGWDMLLMALADPTRMEPVLDSFFRFTLFHMEAWAKTDAEVVIQHDDFVWTAGAFMNPEIYRKMIIPRYAALWKPLHEAGKKVLFCSDGTFTEFAEDIVAAGADGLIFEPSNDFAFMVDRFGDSTCLVGSCTDCRDMTFGTWDTVKASVDRTFELAKKCKGLILSVGNHIPANVPDEMCGAYIDYLKAHWAR